MTREEAAKTWYTSWRAERLASEMLLGLHWKYAKLPEPVFQHDEEAEWQLGVIRYGSENNWLEIFERMSFREVFEEALRRGDENALVLVREKCRHSMGKMECGVWGPHKKMMRCRDCGEFLYWMPATAATYRQL